MSKSLGSEHKHLPKMLWILYLSILSASTRNANGVPGCSLQLSDGFEQTVYTRLYYWELPHHSPAVKSVPIGATVDFHCANGFVQDERENHKRATCGANGKFQELYLYKDYMCRSRYHKHVIVTMKNRVGSTLLHCDGDLRLIYDVHTDKHNSDDHLYTVCMDTVDMRTKFAFQPRRNERPVITEDACPGSNRQVWGFDAVGRNIHEKMLLSRIYEKTFQQFRRRDFFPLTIRTVQYSFDFVLGQLVPYADFGGATNQRATFLYINAAPQWDLFKRGAWSKVEKEAREIRERQPEEWEVYTGTYGTISFDGRAALYVAAAKYNDDKEEVEEILIPVPSAFWKIVHNVHDSRKSRVFIGVNNPHLRSNISVLRDFKMCEPIPHRDTRIGIHGNSSEGFFYECNLNDFLVRLRDDEDIRHDDGMDIDEGKR